MFYLIIIIFFFFNFFKVKATNLEIRGNCSKNNIVKCENVFLSNIKFNEKTFFTISYKVATINFSKFEELLSYVEIDKTDNTSYEIKLKREIFQYEDNKFYLYFGYKKPININKLLYFSNYNNIYSSKSFGFEYIYQDDFSLEVNYNFIDIYIKDNVNLIIDKNIFNNDFMKINFIYEYDKDIKKTKLEQYIIEIFDKKSENYKKLFININESIDERNTFFIDLRFLINKRNSINVYFFHSIRTNKEKFNGIGFGVNV